MRTLILLLAPLVLLGCVESNDDDLKKFVVKAKAKIYPVNDKIPTLEKIDAVAFTQSEGRNPFSKPKAEVIAPVKSAPKTCPQPNFERKKQPLEKYSLDNITMRGTLLINEQLWALVQVSKGELYRVKPGNYLGLNHGKVLNITKNKVELLELASDKDGCWQERITQITLKSK